MADVKQKKRVAIKKGNGLSSPLNDGLENPSLVWSDILIPDALEKVGIGKQNQIQSSEMLPHGRFPVIDQGQDYIAGYCNDESRVILKELPLIIFGDHTRCVKYVDFPFVLGADGTKVLKPKDKLLDTKFFYYALRSLNIPNRGYNRHFSVLKEKRIPLPPLSEQRSIATILGQVQKVIEEQEKLLAVTAELKRTLLHQLFTQGLCNEPQKQTDIGPIPKSWEVVQLGELFQIRHGFAFLGKFFQSQGPYILLTPGHFFEEGGFRDQGEKTKYYVGNFPQSYILAKKDLLVVMTEQKSGLLGSSLMIPKGGLYLHNQRLGLIHALDETRLLKPFLYYLLNTPALRKQISMTASGSKVRHTSPGKIRDIQVAIPPLANQEQAVAVLEALDNKRVVAIKKHANLSDLFRTLLHQLMTGQARNIQAYAHSENDKHESQMEVE